MQLDEQSSLGACALNLIGWSITQKTNICETWFKFRLCYLPPS
jgi:hypothetical protein